MKFHPLILILNLSLIREVLGYDHQQMDACGIHSGVLLRPFRRQITFTVMRGPTTYIIFLCEEAYLRLYGVLRKKERHNASVTK